MTKRPPPPVQPPKIDAEFARRSGLFDPTRQRAPLRWDDWGSHADSFWLAILLCGIVVVVARMVELHAR